MRCHKSLSTPYTLEFLQPQIWIFFFRIRVFQFGSRIQFESHIFATAYVSPIRCTVNVSNVNEFTQRLNENHYIIGICLAGKL